MTAEKGEVKDFDFVKVLLFEADTNTMSSLLEKEVTLGEALFQGTVDIHGNVKKEYIIAWLSKLLRIA